MPAFHASFNLKLHKETPVHTLQGLIQADLLAGCTIYWQVHDKLLAGGEFYLGQTILFGRTCFYLGAHDFIFKSTRRTLKSS